MHTGLKSSATCRLIMGIKSSSFRVRAAVAAAAAGAAAAHTKPGRRPLQLDGASLPCCACLC